jgi:hypothetical protein
MTEPIVTNAADESQVARAKKKEKQRLERDRDDMRWLLSDRRGRRMMHRWLERSGLWRTSFDGPERTFFNEGMRNMGLMLFAEVSEAAPEMFPVMMKEAKEDV